MKVKACFLILPVVHLILAAPVEENSDPEDRRFLRNKRKRPCRRDASGRTFFDWRYHYNININNFFSDCGGYGQFPINRPIGGHNHNNNHQGGGIFGGPFGGGFFGGNNPNKGGGLFGLGLFDWLGGSSSRPGSNRPKPGSTEAPQAPESDTEDDYEDDKPDANVDIDEVVLDRNPNAPYGNSDVTNFNPSKVVKRVSTGIDNFFRPFYDLFR